MRKGLVGLVNAFFHPAPPPIHKHWVAKIFELPSTRQRRKLTDSINRQNHRRWKLKLAGKVLAVVFSWAGLLTTLMRSIAARNHPALLLVTIPLVLLMIWLLSRISIQTPPPSLLAFNSTNDAAGYALGGTGLIGGALSGAVAGGHVGLAMGPLGAIAGTIPGAMIGAVIGLLGGVQTADAVVLKKIQRQNQGAGAVGGLLAGAAGGAWFGSGMGLALGPAGAIAATIPGAIIGGTVGLLTGLRLAG